MRLKFVYYVQFTSPIMSKFGQDAYLAKSDMVVDAQFGSEAALRDLVKLACAAKVFDIFEMVVWVGYTIWIGGLLSWFVQPSLMYVVVLGACCG